MTSTTRRRALQLIGGTLAGIPFATTALARQDGGARGRLKRQIARVRAATASFRDSSMAEAAGYAPITPFVCGMGYHWGNEAEIGRLLGGGSVDPQMPPVINYGEDSEGDLILGAVEYFAPMERFDANEDLVAHYQEPPNLFGDEGVTLYHAEEWEVLPASVSGLPVDVWALHVWAHRRNPNGVFAHTNSRDLFNKDGCVQLEGE